VVVKQAIPHVPIWNHLESNLSEKWMAINFSHDVKNEQIEIYIIHVHSIEKKQYVRQFRKKTVYLYLQTLKNVCYLLFSCLWIYVYPPKKEIFHQPT